MRRWIEEASPLRFGIALAAFFAVLIAWTWSYAEPREPRVDFRDNSTPPVTTEVGFPRAGLPR